MKILKKNIFIRHSVPILRVPIGMTTEAFIALEKFEMSALPCGWHEWENVVQVISAEEPWGHCIERVDDYPVTKIYKKEPFSDAEVKFVERDEHFWWAEPQSSLDKEHILTLPDKDKHTHPFLKKGKRNVISPWEGRANLVIMKATYGEKKLSQMLVCWRS